MATKAMEAESPLLDRRDWRTAFESLRRLLSDPNDTVAVFRIMRALNAGSAKRGYQRLLKSLEGGRIAYERAELADRLSDADFITACPPGSVGAAYAAFLQRTGYSAQGLAMISRTDDLVRETPHPYAWFGRRIRDSHDLWHVLTGYRADEPLGEACLVAFSYAQTKGLGWALIAVGVAAKAWQTPLGRSAIAAIWEGFQRGRRAAWLPGEDYEHLLLEPIETARRRLGIDEPAAYRAVQTRMAQLA
jgi:ubiquinone biosynthesis protein COQ4